MASNNNNIFTNISDTSPIITPSTKSGNSHANNNNFVPVPTPALSSSSSSSSSSPSIKPSTSSSNSSRPRPLVLNHTNHHTTFNNNINDHNNNNHHHNPSPRIPGSSYSPVSPTFSIQSTSTNLVAHPVTSDLPADSWESPRPAPSVPSPSLSYMNSNTPLTATSATYTNNTTASSAATIDNNTNYYNNNSNSNTNTPTSYFDDTNTIDESSNEDHQQSYFQQQQQQHVDNHINNNNKPRGRDRDRKLSAFVGLGSRSKSSSNNKDNNRDTTPSSPTSVSSKSGFRSNASSASYTTSTTTTTTGAAANSSRNRRSSFGRILAGLSGSNKKEKESVPPLPTSPPPPNPPLSASTMSTTTRPSSSGMRASSDRPSSSRSTRSKNDNNQSSSTATATTTSSSSSSFKPAFLKRVTKAASAPDLKQLAAKYEKSDSNALSHSASTNNNTITTNTITNSPTSPVSKNSRSAGGDRVFVVDESAPPVPAQVPLQVNIPPPISPSLFHHQQQQQQQQQHNPDLARSSIASKGDSIQSRSSLAYANNDEKKVHRNNIPTTPSPNQKPNDTRIGLGLAHSGQSTANNINLTGQDSSASSSIFTPPRIHEGNGDSMSEASLYSSNDEHNTQRVVKLDEFQQHNNSILTQSVYSPSSSSTNENNILGNSYNNHYTGNNNSKQPSIQTPSSLELSSPSSSKVAATTDASSYFCVTSSKSQMSLVDSPKDDARINNNNNATTTTKSAASAHGQEHSTSSSTSFAPSWLKNMTGDPEKLHSPIFFSTGFDDNKMQLDQIGSTTNPTSPSSSPKDYTNNNNNNNSNHHSQHQESRPGQSQSEVLAQVQNNHISPIISKDSSYQSKNTNESTITSSKNQHNIASNSKNIIKDNEQHSDSQLSIEAESDTDNDDTSNAFTTPTAEHTPLPPINTLPSLENNSNYNTGDINSKVDSVSGEQQQLRQRESISTAISANSSQAARSKKSKKFDESAFGHSSDALSFSSSDDDDDESDHADDEKNDDDDNDNDDDDESKFHTARSRFYPQPVTTPATANANATASTNQPKPKQEEDLPLGAQPGALTAQKSFREKESRRKASTKVKHQSETSSSRNQSQNKHQETNVTLTSQQKPKTETSNSTPSSRAVSAENRRLPDDQDPRFQDAQQDRSRPAPLPPLQSQQKQQQSSNQKQQSQPRPRSLERNYFTAPQRQLPQPVRPLDIKPSSGLTKSQPASSTKPVKNPFSFAPGELNRLKAEPYKQNVEPEFNAVGHSLLPQNDDSIKRRTRRRRATTGTRTRPSRKFLEENSAPFDFNPNKNISNNKDNEELDPPIAPFVHNSVLTCSEDETTSDAADDAPIISVLPKPSNTAEHVASSPLSSSTPPSTNAAPSSYPFPRTSRDRNDRDRENVKMASNNEDQQQNASVRSRSQSFTNGVKRAFSTRPSSGSDKDSRPNSGKDKHPPLPAIDTKVGGLSNNNSSSNQPSPRQPYATLNSAASGSPSKLTVYVDGMNHFLSLDLEGNETVKHIIEKVRSLGQLKRRTDAAAEGGWALHECWTKLGIERPLRNTEKISDIMKSWTPGSDSTVLMVKKTPLAPLLSSKRTAPTNPVHQGAMIYIELRRGKWNKRYVEIKNGNVYYSKDNQGKDETFLCTISGCDGFLIDSHGMGRVRPPKSFAFAIKSLDPVTFFENKEDYMHNFSVKTLSERDQWIQAILDARMYHTAQIQAKSPPPRFQQLPSQQQQQQQQQQQNHQQQQSTTQTRERSSSNAKGGLVNESNNNGPFNAGSLLSRVDQEDSVTSPITPGGATNGFPDTRTWNRMSPDERKAYVLATQKNARAEGRTLLNFDNQNGSSNPNSNGISSTPSLSRKSSSKRPVTASRATEQAQQQRVGYEQQQQNFVSQQQRQLQRNPTNGTTSSATRLRSKSFTRTR